MPIWDNNGSTNYEVGKLWDNNGSTSSQIGKVYDNNGTTNSLIYSAEETLFSGLSFGTESATGWNETKEANSSTYTATGFATMRVTGTVTRTVTSGEGTGYYGCQGTVYLQGLSGSTWVNLATLSNSGFNTTSTSTIDQTVNISGYSSFRIHLVCTSAAQTLRVAGKVSVSNFAGVVTA